MGKIYCVMGKSSSGKDSIYHQIMEKGVLALKPIIPAYPQSQTDLYLTDSPAHTHSM